MSTTTTKRDRRKFLHEIFTTAMEGGVQCWAQLSEYRWLKDGVGSGAVNWDTDLDLDGFKAVLVPSEAEGCWGVFDDDEKDKGPLTVDADVIRRGVGLFKRYCAGEIDHNGRDVDPEKRVELNPTHYWRQFLESERTNGDEGDYDADVADWIVQFGLFGMGVYG